MSTIYDFLKIPQVPRALAHPIGPTDPRLTLPNRPEGTAGIRAAGPTTPAPPCPSSAAAAAPVPTVLSTTLTRVTSIATTRELATMVRKGEISRLSCHCSPHTVSKFSDGPLQGHQDRGQRGDEPALQRPRLRPRPVRDLQCRRHQQQLVPPRPHHGRAGLQHADSGKDLL